MRDDDQRPNGHISVVNMNHFEYHLVTPTLCPQRKIKEKDTMISTSKVEELLKNNLPVEIRYLITGLKSDVHWAVFIYLAEHTTTRLNNIVDVFEADGRTIKKILHDLTNCGLVDQKISRLCDIGKDDAYFYNVTISGKKFLEAMWDQLPK